MISMSDFGMRSLDSVKQPSPRTARILVAIFECLAIVVTVFRLTVRFRRRRLWWEDFWAAVASVGAFIAMVSFWVRTDSPPTSGTVHESIEWTRVNTYWFVALSFTCVLWAARMSMMFSIIRITPPMHRLRTAANCSAALFVLCWIGLMVQKLYICTTTEKTWYHSPTTECHLGESVVILELCTDFVSDTLLILLPLLLLWNITLPRQQRRLILVLFSASILTLVVSVVHAVFLIGPDYLLEGVSAELEGAVSLIVCNLLVSVTYLYRVTHKGRDIDTDPVYDYQTEEMPATGVSRDGPITSMDLRNISTNSTFTSEYHSRGENDLTSADTRRQFDSDKP